MDDESLFNELILSMSSKELNNYLEALEAEINFEIEKTREYKKGWNKNE